MEIRHSELYRIGVERKNVLMMKQQPNENIESLFKQKKCGKKPTAERTEERERLIQRKVKHWIIIFVAMIKWLFRLQSWFFPSSFSAIVIRCVRTRCRSIRSASLPGSRDIVSLFFASCQVHECVAFDSLGCMKMHRECHQRQTGNCKCSTKQKFSSHDNNEYNLHVWWFAALSLSLARCTLFWSQGAHARTHTCSSVFRL